ncbi:Uncharacterized protein TPAR_06948 [Tolypocladium paradoxum]|uniref:Uncharacterized protein n=1 Tax=Tolypocladium paradoxum TaxID=94208 RepID=A0A2S4KRP9_9HYPO|nr:Uncharacterized protein TPAR_06948 [Tolypocladium paradoxum]
MSQVKNLRAMFENKGDTSPPDRGRSPGVSTSTSHPAGNGTGSPRPLSKVRTNFVAIEKDGRMGLRRDHSGESSLSRRRLSIETDAESTSTFPERPAMASSDDLTKPMRKLFVSEPIPESPRQPLDANHRLQDAAAVSDKPSTDPDKQLDEQQPAAALAAADLTTKTSSEGADAKETTPVSSNGGRKGDKNQASASAAQPRTTATAPKKGAATTTNAAKPTAKPTTKAPAASKSSAEAPKRADAKLTPKASEKPGPKRETAAATAKPATAAAKPKPISSAAANRPQPLKTAGHSDTGFVKPKPKSPTKPVNLPPSLMAPTASSVSKGGAPRQSLSRQSGSLQNPSAPAHSSIRASTSTTSTSAQRIKRQGSVIGRPRPSVGPPPSRASQPDATAGKRQSHVDEGFLARMMRPTQSSSSKTADKNLPTPPKKTAPRPSTSATDHSLRQETSARKPPVAKNAAAKRSSQELEVARTPEKIPHETVNTKTTRSAASSVQGHGEVQTTVVPRNPEPAPEPEQADAIAPETAQVNATEEVATMAHEADLVQTPVEPRDPAPAHEPAPVENAAPETARLETAEEAVALAQDTDLVETSAEPDNTTAHLDLIPADEPAPEADHTEVAEGDKGLSHEDIGHSRAPAEETALELDIPEPGKNTESDAGDAAHELAEEPFAESADVASENVPEVATVEDGKVENVPVHDTTSDAEAQHETEASDHGPLSGSEQQIKAAGADLVSQ